MGNTRAARRDGRGKPRKTTSTDRRPTRRFAVRTQTSPSPSARSRTSDCAQGRTQTAPSLGRHPPPRSPLPLLLLPALLPRLMAVVRLDATLPSPYRRKRVPPDSSPVEVSAPRGCSIPKRRAARRGRPPAGPQTETKDTASRMALRPSSPACSSKNAKPASACKTSSGSPPFPSPRPCRGSGPSSFRAPSEIASPYLSERVGRPGTAPRKPPRTPGLCRILPLIDNPRPYRFFFGCLHRRHLRPRCHLRRRRDRMRACRSLSSPALVGGVPPKRRCRRRGGPIGGRNE